MRNYFVEYLNSYFEEILQIERKHFIACASLNYYKARLKQENPQNKELLSIITSYRDLTAINANENLYIPDYSYSLDVNGLDENIDDVVSQLSCLAVSQAYEVIESYLISILTEFFFRNQDKLAFVKWETEKLPLLKSEVRVIVKKNQGKNNRNLINALKKVSGNFRNSETKNIHKVNICTWFDVISMARHTLVHNRQIISDGFLDYLKKSNAEDIFKRHFKQKFIDANIHIYLGENDTRDIINWLNSFAHLIFISLSNEQRFSLKVPQLQPHERN